MAGGGTGKTGAAPGRARADDGHDHDHQDDHDQHLGQGIVRYGAALALAVLAEAGSFGGPDTLPWRIGGMVLALVAIGLAGLETYQNGFEALRRGRLTIAALMSVAVTGAFLIGQWPEAAVVMALYAIAEWLVSTLVSTSARALEPHWIGNR